MIEMVFIHGAQGHVLLTWHPPTPPAAAALLLHPPLFETLNHSRRHLAATARKLAHHGYGVLIPDLCGCGDSEGACAEATWAGWQADLACCAQWLAQRHPDLPQIGWGVGSGALLLSNATYPLSGWCLWQPHLTGTTTVNEWVRTLVLAWRLSGKSGGVDAVRERFFSGQLPEIGGYDWSCALIDTLDQQTLQLPQLPIGWLFWNQPPPMDQPHITPIPISGPPTWQYPDGLLQPQATNQTHQWLQQNFANNP